MFCISDDEDTFTGEFPTQEAAMEAAPADLDLGTGDTFYVGRAIPPDIGFYSPNASQIIETLTEAADEDVGSECAEGWLENVDVEAQDELSGMIANAIGDWLRMRGLLPTFYKVTDITEHKVLGAFI